MNLWAVFLTGLLTGGLTCLAVQGGLLAATLAQREEERLKLGLAKSGNALPILSFLGAKLLAYTVLGLVLGWVGSVFQLSITTQIVLQAAVAIFMIGTAFNLLNVHPIFRYFVITPPRFLTRLVRNQSQSQDFFAPALLGAFTIFIPCGTTQAMMALAIASGNPLSGALILFAFVLGTSPLFFILGYFATRLGEALHQKFMRVAAAAIMLLAAFNLHSVLALSGAGGVVEAAFRGVYCTVSFCNENPTLLHDVATRTVNIEFRSTGYEADQTTVRAGSEVTLNLINRDGRGCIQAFTIPRLGIQEIVRTGTAKTITITAPSEPGTLAFMCSMGMFQGKLTVI